MRCPNLEELPAPPTGKTGWPWTEESNQLPDKMSDGSPWPKISIVTPSYNQGQFIEETIRSVLLQGYPNLEYIIIDGGSTDGSVKIIKKYEPWLQYWVSEPDRGQSHAINKGFRKATGELFGWLNSDDFYLPAALGSIAKAYSTTKEECGVIGIGRKVGPKGEFIYEKGPESLSFSSIREWGENWFMQQACFFSGTAYWKVGGLDESLQYVMDFDLWLKLLKKIRFVPVDRCLAASRKHPSAKTIEYRGKQIAETIIVKVRHGGEDEARKEIEKLYNNLHDIQEKIKPFTRSFIYRLLRPVIKRSPWFK